MLAPEVFDQDEDDGLVIVLQVEPGEPAQQARVREAAAVCPTAAITLGE